MTFHLIRINLSSFFPPPERGHRLIFKTSEELREEFAKEESFADKLDNAWWEALRGFFGEHQLPPEDLMDAFFEKNLVDVFAPWEEWRTPLLKDDEPHTIFSPSTDDDYPCYVEVGHGDHFDLLSYGHGWADLLFRHASKEGRDDQEMVHAFFHPLLERLRTAQLTLGLIQMYLTFVDDQGLHTTSLVTTLEKLGML